MSVRSDPYRRRWLVWAILAAGFLLVNVYRLSTGVLTDDLARLYDATATEIGTLHAAFFYIYAPLQIAAGVLADRAGIRRSATVGVGLMSLSGFAFALAPTYLVAFGARVGIGLGASVVFITTLRFCANWFRPNEFATVSGLTVAVAGLGGVLATTPLALAVGTVGLRATLVGLSTVGLVIAATIALLARDSPADAGLPAIEGVPASRSLTLSEVLRSVRTVLEERETWLVAGVMFCTIGVNITVLGAWAVPYVAQVYGLSVPRASTFALAGSIGLLLGPPLIGRLSDATGRRTGLMVVGALAFAASYGALALLRLPLLAVGGVFFLASATGGASSLSYTAIKERHAAAASGVATGVVNTGGFLGAAVFPTVMGALLDSYWTGRVVGGARVYAPAGFQAVFGLAAGAGLLALACAAWLHWRGRHEVGARGEKPTEEGPTRTPGETDPETETQAGTEVRTDD